ncbi:MAG: molecular chaperone Hsp33 [Myxococcota bacterium]|jgi:molecular chaperone Hsp33
MDTSTRGLVGGDAVRIVVIDATEVSNYTAEIHELGLGASRLAAELSVAALLMGGHIKGEERVTLQLQTSNPEASVFAEVDSLGTIRGRAMPTRLPVTTSHTGMLLAIKSDAQAELYRGVTEVAGQTLQSALASHMRDSQQVQGNVLIDVVVGANGVERAVGLLVERLASDPVRPSLTRSEFAAAYSDLTVADLNDALSGTLRGDSIRVLDQLPLMWMCRCSREKVDAMLMSVGNQTLQSMHDEDEGAEISCHFCGDTRVYTKEELAALIQSNK